MRQPWCVRLGPIVKVQSRRSSVNLPPGHRRHLRRPRQAKVIPWLPLMLGLAEAAVFLGGKAYG